MNTLQTYLECGEGYATPANTMGMGNPGETGPDTLSEPIGGIEKTAKSEAEKDKKKRKRKIKSLFESLFDNNIEKDVLIGDVLELEEWECASLEDYKDMGVILDSTFSPNRKNKLIKLPKWKKFLSPFESIYGTPFINLDYYKQRIRCLDCWQLRAFTWVVMCCTSLKEIPIKLNEFMKEISRDINNDGVFDEDLYIRKINIIPLEGLGDMKGLPRLVVIKFKIKGREVVVYMKLIKKRD